MYCQNCGEAVDDSAKFCSNCGQNLASPPLQARERVGDRTGAKSESAEPTVDQTGRQWEPSQRRRNGERILKSFDANRTQSEGRAVGGKLFLTNQRLLFEPGSIDSKTGGEKVTIELDAVEKVSKESRGGRSLKDTFFGGGLRNRLRIDVNDQTTELLVVSNLSTVLDEINTAVEGGSIESEERVREWNPRIPITSAFVAVMLLWTAFHYGRFSDFLIFGVPAVLIIPRVRRRIVPWVRERFNVDLSAKGSVVAVAGIYAILFLMSAASMIGSVGSDPTIGGSPTRQVTIGLVSILIAFGIAAVTVTAVRVNRKLRA